MPAVQTTYGTTMRQAFAGLKGDMTPETIVSRVIETSGGIGFGLAVKQGTGDRQVRFAGSLPFVGVTLVDQTAGATALTPPVNADQYQQGDIAAVMMQGTVWVLADQAVVAGVAATYTQATGRIGQRAVAGDVVAIPNSVIETSGADGALVLLRLK